MQIGKSFVYRRYTLDEVKRKIVDVLQGASTGLSGIELADRTDINRMTITKYLDVLHAMGLVKKKKTGNVNVWFLETGIADIEFPINYVQVQQKRIAQATTGTALKAEAVARKEVPGPLGAQPRPAIPSPIRPNQAAADKQEEEDDRTVSAPPPPAPPAPPAPQQQAPLPQPQQPQTPPGGQYQGPPPQAPPPGQFGQQGPGTGPFPQQPPFGGPQR